ncbi:MAG TPA: aldehyde dehydrogenase family protein [Longimicrobiaceae bacterium]|nr:aldehyde dehydrogenase family protein [Longimicrobiaceae bacterium]
MSTVSELFETLEYGPAPESAALALRWIEEQGGEFGHFFGGEWRKGESFFETASPASGEVLARIAQGSEEEVDEAVAVAREAQPGWWGAGGHKRARYLYAIARQIQKESRLFAVLETLDNGKPIRESRDADVPLAIRHFYHHAGWAQLLERELPDHVPLGVAGQIIPWNFPLLMLAWKVAPALATGNTVVLKPAELTPLTSLLFARICERVGLPAGVFNLVTGDGRTGQALVRHPGIDKIAFTGSTEVGREIRIATAGTGKKLTLELGGKSPFIVFDDADLDAAVEGVVDSIWYNQGEVCCAGSRILAQEGIADRLAEKLRVRMEALRVGDPLDKNTDIGALASAGQLARVRGYVTEAEEEGASVWMPQRPLPNGKGCYHAPTLITGAGPASRVMVEEIFGPVVVMSTFRTPEEAVELANHTRYGLAASVWTENINVALDIAPRVVAGTVWVNCANTFDGAAGFGGRRESGFGREGGREGLFEYVKERRPERRPEKKKKRAGKSADGVKGTGLPAIDRTAKLYIGGQQVRPDSGYSREIAGRDGTRIGEVPRGNRKDVRNAVEAALAGGGWSRSSVHLRGQILYYLAENLAARADEFARTLHASAEAPEAGQAAHEVELSVERLFACAARADKWDGLVHGTPYRMLTIAQPEPMGVIGIVCPDEAPLLALVSALGAAISVGNRVVVVPSSRSPFPAVDFYQLMEASDVPPGAINIVTGDPLELGRVLAAHDGVDAFWWFAREEGIEELERLSAGNLKRVWTEAGARDWFDAREGEGPEFLRHATQVKNIWVPYGA